VKSTRQSHFYC